MKRFAQTRREGGGRRTAPIGLVLSGGGAKGAYQAGVWTALAERGLAERVKAISGTSVGAINAAVFAAVRDPARIVAFWRSRVGGAVAERPEGLLSGEALAAWAERAAAGFARGAGFPFPGALDRSGLERALRDLLPERWPESSPAVYATALECVGGPWPAGRLERRVFRIDAEPDAERRRRMVLASSAIPFGLDPVEIDGAHFVDGGWEAMGGDNTPAAPILENHPDIRTLVVVHLNAESTAEGPWRRPTRLPALLGGVRYVEIRPSLPLPGLCDGLAQALELLPDDDLAREAAPLARFLRRTGGVFAFDPASAVRSLALGRADALRILDDNHGFFR